MDFAPIESPPTISQYLSIQSFSLSTAIYPEFQRKIMAPNLSPPICGYRIDIGSRIVHTFLFDFYTHYMPNLHRLVTIDNAADRPSDRQTDGNRPPML